MLTSTNGRNLGETSLWSDRAVEIGGPHHRQGWPECEGAAETHGRFGKCTTPHCSADNRIGIQVKIPDEEVKNAAGNGEEEKKETGAGDASPNPAETTTAEKKEHAQKEGWCIRVFALFHSSTN